jgi:hypothetical protein
MINPTWHTCDRCLERKRRAVENLKAHLDIHEPGYDRASRAIERAGKDQVLTVLLEMDGKREANDMGGIRNINSFIEAWINSVPTRQRINEQERRERIAFPVQYSRGIPVEDKLLNPDGYPGD